MKEKAIAMVLFFMTVNNVEGQRLEDMTNYPAPPQTTALFKAIAAPVSYYTGQPDISIPLYTISQDGVEVPISISFNTSGIFVTEEATSVGLGVRLDWGGAVNRSINGSPDERGFFTNEYLIGELKQEISKDYSNHSFSGCYPYCHNSTSYGELQNRIYLYYEANKYNDPSKPTPSPADTDFRPDDFHYNVLDKSGKFKFNQLERKFVTFPLDDIKIEKFSNGHNLEKFYITKSDGVKITLGDGAIEYAKKYDSGPGFIQTWFVKNIATVKNSVIDFSYITNEYVKAGISNPEIRVPGIGFYNNTAPIADVLHETLIKTINFNQGKLEFTYVNDRSDFIVNNLNSNPGQPAPRLSKIVLSNMKNQPIKTFQFYQSYFTNGALPSVDNKRLRLDSLSIQDNVSSNVEKYKFEYHNSNNLPSKKSLARDHWGYFNGATTNTTLIPSTVVPIGYNYSGQFDGMSWSGYDNFHDKYMQTIKGNRFINSSTNKCFTLKKIKFPTGGEREYIYEDNDVPYTELYNQIKDITNDGYEIFSQRLLAGGATLSSSEQTVTSNANNTERTLYGTEFNIQDFSDTVLGEPSLFVRTNYVNPAVTLSQLNMWAYKIEIGLQKKTGSTFGNYSNYITVNRSDSNFNMSPAPLMISDHLPVLPDGIYRIYIKMTCPPSYVMNNWLNQSGQIINYYHNTVVGLTYRKKNFDNIRVGGLRIKDIIDTDGTNEYKTTYEYTGLGANSSGRLVNFPEYKERINTAVSSPTPDGAGNYYRPYHGYRICSEAVLPLLKTQGSNVGYTNVTKKVIGGNELLKEEFVFKFTQSLTFGYMRQYYQETEPRPWQSGKLLSHKKYKGSSVVSEDIFDYYGLINETDKGFVEEINTSLVQGSVYNLVGYSDSVWDIAIERRDSNPVVAMNMAEYPSLYYFDNRTDCLFQYGQNNSSWFVVTLPDPAKIPYFKSYTGFDKLKSQTTTNYFGSVAVTKIKNYYYDAVPASLSLSREESSDSQNGTTVSKFYYPQDLLSEPFMPALVEANRVGSPIKTEQFKNGTKISEDKTVYSKDATTGNLLLPKNVYSAKFPNMLPIIANIGQLEKKLTYDLYDSNGMLLQYTSEGGMPTSIVWGYNKSLPIAKIENATYFQVATALNINTSILDTYTEANLGSLNMLRNNTSMLNSMITTYTYKPLVGVTDITDPKGAKTTYEYDSFGRLKAAYDHEGKLLSENDYHYKN